VSVRIIDLYSIKPIDSTMLKKAARETGRILVVEDHRPEGGIAEAVRTALGSLAGTVTSLAVSNTPRSGTTAETLTDAGISSRHIIQAVHKTLKKT
jgi:transketolase